MVRTKTASRLAGGPVVVLLALIALLLLPAVAQAATGTVTWQGRGPNPVGAQVSYEFILTPGGTTVLQSGTLTVTFTGGATKTVSGQHMGGSRGALHFFVTGTGPVVSASAFVTYTGSIARSVLTISSATVLSTTTTVGGVTSTTEHTTTTEKNTTTTAQGETSTTVAGETSTTVAGETSTTGAQAGTTSTTLLGASTSAATTTTTVQTPTRIETGGGGTAGGSDHWLLAALITSVLGGLSVLTGKLAWAKWR